MQLAVTTKKELIAKGTLSIASRTIHDSDIVPLLDRLRVRPPPGQRQVDRLRRQRLQLRQELVQVLRRLGQDPGQHDSQGTGADPPHPLDDALPARRPAHRANHRRKNVSSEKSCSSVGRASFKGPSLVQLYH